MVKVDLKILDSTTANDVTATKTINDNFEALQNAVEDSLSRSGKVPNYMQTDLDLNHNKLINLADPKEDRDAVTLKYVKDTIGDAKGYADKAEAEAIKANKTVEAARAYLQNSVDEARIWAKEAEESVSEAKEYANDAESGANIASASAARAQESALEAMSAKEYAEQAANNASIVVAEVKDDVIANTSEIAELKEIVNNIGTGGGDSSSGGSGRNVGDIFYTTRQDSELNGAVECNGATYNIGDFTGTESISELLLSRKIMYVPFFQYEMSIEDRGFCEYFAYDGHETFKVPTLPTVILASNQAPVVGNGMALGLTDGVKNGGFTTGTSITTTATGNLTTYGQPVGTTPTSSTAASKLDTNVAIGITTDPTKSGMVANLDTIAVEYRAMVQLANEATDEAVITATNALVEINRLSQSLNEINAELENFAKIDGSNYANSSLEDIVNERIVMTTITYLE